MLSRNPKHGKTLRVGFLSRWDLNDPNAMSGTVHRCAKALTEAGIELVDFSNLARTKESVWTKPLKYTGSDNPNSLPVRVKAQWFRRHIKALLLKFCAPWSEHREVLLARKIGDLAKQQLHDTEQELDAVFGVCCSAEIANLNIDVPIIYASDTTTQLYNESYMGQKQKSQSFKNAQNTIETQALENCQYFLPASECGFESALRDYRIPQNYIKLIEFGAHITPKTKIEPKQAPTKNALQLCLVASDPERKQLPLCIAIAEELAQRGWRVELNYIGKYHPAISKSKLVNWVGNLQLSKTSDREKHRQMLNDSHWMLLPSKAEAFGIAACEAAHFGVPCAVSDAGGLPTVVKNGVTGIVLPLQAGSTTYANAMEKVMLNPGRYNEMSRAAIARAKSTLSWDVWGQRVKDIVMECVARKNSNELKASKLANYDSNDANDIIAAE